MNQDSRFAAEEPLAHPSEMPRHIRPSHYAPNPTRQRLGTTMTTGLRTLILIRAAGVLAVRHWAYLDSLKSPYNGQPTSHSPTAIPTTEKAALGERFLRSWRSGPRTCPAPPAHPSFGWNRPSRRQFVHEHHARAASSHCSRRRVASLFFWDGRAKPPRIKPSPIHAPVNETCR